MIISLYKVTDRLHTGTMQIRFKILCLGVAAALVSFAAAPVARVISTGPVNVDGIIGPARNFVPLTVGNEITTEGASAVVQFPDGGAVTLQPHSKLRIEGSPSGPSAVVVRGSAIYDVARTSSSSGRVGNGVSKPMVGVPASVSWVDPATNRGGSSGTPATAGFMYRGVAGKPGVVAPPAASFVGGFTAGGSTAGTGAGSQITGPNGLTINLTAVVDPNTGATTYVVASMQQTITLPGGGTAVVTVTSGPLIGATVGGGATGTTFTPPGSAIPLTPQQTASAVQAGVQDAINKGVTNGTLPGGTQPPPPSPVTTGQFSASGS
jgi:hypothetical protein